MSGFEETRISWRKSIASGTSDCAEVAVDGGRVLVRDTADRGGAVLRLTPAAWSAFLERTRGPLAGPRS